MPPSPTIEALVTTPPVKTGATQAEAKQASPKVTSKQSLDKVQQPVPLTECVTLFVSSERCGKVFERQNNREVKKTSIATVHATKVQTVHVPDAPALAALLQRVMTTPNAGLILDAIKGTNPGDILQCLTIADLARRLDIPVTLHGDVAPTDRSRVVGIHLIDGVRCVARMKENFEPGMWQLLDRDIDEFTPDEFGAAKLPFSAWLELLDTKLLPGLKDCERVMVPSSSARVIDEITRKPVGSGNGHVFVRVSDPARMGSIGKQLRFKAKDAGIAWAKPIFSRTTGAQIGERSTTLIDYSVLHIGRLVFEGQPHLAGAGLALAPPAAMVREGPALDLSTFADLPDADIERLNASSPTKLRRERDGSLTLHNDDTLKLDTEIERADGTRLTVQEWIDQGAMRMRIQAPFRASESMAAFIARSANGLVYLHDAGEGITYYLSKPAAHEAFTEISPEHQAAAASQAGPQEASKTMKGPRDGAKARNWLFIGDEPDEPEEATWLLRGLIDQNDFAMVYGARSSAKTFLAVDMAVCLAAGLPWFGHQASPGSGIVYVANENSRGVRRRLRASAKDRGLRLDELPIVVTKKPVNMKAQPAVTEQMVKQAAAGLMLKFGVTHILVVFDTLARVWGGINDNDAADMNLVIGHCDTFRTLGYTVMVIHHVGKDASKGPRGHSSLDSAVDVAIKAEGDHKTPRSIEVTKLRDGETGETQVFILRTVVIGPDKTGAPVTSAVVESAGAMPKGGQTKKLTANQKAVLNALHKAVHEHGLCVNNGSPPQQRPKAVGIDVWRDTYLAPKGSLEAAERKNERQLFNRSVERLQAAGLVAARDDQFWAIAPATATVQ